MAAIAVSAPPGSYSYVRGHGCRVVGGPAVASTLAGARLASRLVSSRRWRAADLGRGLRTTGRRAYDGRSIRGGGISLARAVWKQEVLWTEAPIADIGFAAEQHFQLVLDISANSELRDGHTKPGQFVQVRIGDSKPAFLAIASPPRLAATGSLEFLLKSVEGTTAGLLCSLQKGDKVELSQVMGNGFSVEQVSPAEDFPTILLFCHWFWHQTVNGICKCRRPGKQLRDETWEKLYYLGQASGCKNNGHVASTITVAFKGRDFCGRTGTGGEEEACWDVKTLCEKGRWQEAVELLLNDRVVRVDSQAYASVLQACTKMKALPQGKQIHAHLLKRKWHLDIFLGNNLLNMYTQCGSLPDACKLFDEMQRRNIDTWNAMIRGFAEQGHFEDALTVLLQMQREKVLPSRYTFMSLVNGCARFRTLEKGKHVHALSIKAGLASDTWVGNALIDMYAKCGSVEDARGVFDGMQKRDVVSWNAMIAGYSRQNLHEDAFSLFDEMQTAGIVPTKFTMTSILGACCSPAALEQGKQIHACCSKAGFESDIRVGTALVSMYAKCGSVLDAKKVFDKMPTRNTFSWTAMIRAYAREGYGAKALELFAQMKQEGVMPDRVLFLSILNAIASPGALQIGRQIHAQVIEAGLESDLPVTNALISMYAKCGSMEDAHRIFDSMPQRNVVSWTAMISGYAQQNHSKAAIEVFSQMQREGVKPDRVTFISILDACANLAALQKGKSIHAQILKAGLDSDNGVEIALVNMYAKCGSLVHADQVFDKMLQRDVVVWTVMIVGYAQHGRGKEAIQLFEWMKREGVKPDSLTFTGLLTACSHVGLVEEGRFYFQSITQDYGITPAMQHYGSMVDLLGRAGRLDEAADFIEKMPFEADASVWGALLGACKIHCNVELAECAAKRLLVLDPDNGSWYLLLSNIYAAAGMSDKAQYMRKFMKKEGAMKDPGPSWVEVDNEVHLFVAEDRSHQYRGERNEIGHADEKDERERIYIS